MLLIKNYSILKHYLSFACLLFSKNMQQTTDTPIMKSDWLVWKHCFCRPIKMRVNHKEMKKSELWNSCDQPRVSWTKGFAWFLLRSWNWYCIPHNKSTTPKDFAVLDVRIPITHFFVCPLLCFLIRLHNISQNLLSSVPSSFHYLWYHLLPCPRHLSFSYSQMVVLMNLVT